MWFDFRSFKSTCGPVSFAIHLFVCLVLIKTFCTVSRGNFHDERSIPCLYGVPLRIRSVVEEGLRAQAFLNYRADAQWYSIQTGDTSLVMEITSTDCAECLDQYEAYEKMYSEGNWAAGGFETAKIEPHSFTKRPDGGYNLPVRIKSSGATAIVDGKIPRRQLPFDSSEGFDVYLYRENAQWVYLTGSPRGSL